MTLIIGPLRDEPGRKTRGTVPVDLGPTTVDGGLLEPDDVVGQVVICPVANPPGVYDGRLGKSRWAA
ncbi:hypothetical protein [Streptomyces lomondensis]|uniref:Uncharacterized protein n=1 Tax=Streptomyces lomondensis TaxID=68229 RepID=A0ABQ2X821_9ACTN|nr:hypothetical protein [Streptomyces lomondensis]MCF0082429.1 hypothetical protein [Streptomyces lomondensis]GGX04177.1 hypothetical protein GCM10010383_37530 [Streptomyces lomondensis]